MKSWEEACFVVFQVSSKQTTLKSDFGRAYAETIAWAIARGYLTTEVAPWTRQYGNTIKATHKGLLFLEDALHGLDRDRILDIVNGTSEQENPGFLDG